MNTQTQEALKMAIVVMQTFDSQFPTNSAKEAIQACKEALAQPAQEHIGYYYPDERMACLLFKKGLEIPRDALPLYGSPAPSWQGLSDDEIETQITIHIFGNDADEFSLDIENIRNFGRAIEQALKEKNS